MLIEHATVQRYWQGCRCADCRAANTAYEKTRRRARGIGPRIKRPAEERFWEKVCKTEDCWLWTGALNHDGYGLFKAYARTEGAHRISYRWAHGPIPEGFSIDHLCRTRNCVRPDHLEAVTQAENTARGKKTHCIRGHEFTLENTYYSRMCRACWDSRKQEKREAS